MKLKDVGFDLNPLSFERAKESLAKKILPLVKNCLPCRQAGLKFRAMAARIATRTQVTNLEVIRYWQFLLIAIALNFSTSIFHRRGVVFR